MACSPAIIPNEKTVMKILFCSDGSIQAENAIRFGGIIPPVLAVIGSRARLQKILICSGGENYIDKALELTGHLAQNAGATVTLLHVMAEPPQMYAELIAREENVDLLLNSSSLLGQN